MQVAVVCSIEFLIDKSSLPAAVNVQTIEHLNIMKSCKAGVFLLVQS